MASLRPIVEDKAAGALAEAHRAAAKCGGTAFGAVAHGPACRRLL